MRKSSKLKCLIVFCLCLLEITMTFLMVKSFSNREVNEVKEKSIVNKKLFAMYIENDSGEYEEVTDTETFPLSGYSFNPEKSKCVDAKGILVEDILSGNGSSVTVTSNKTIFCYLYFDLDNSVYAKVVSDYTKNNGAKLLSGTESDTYPTYYYNGSITNNNILYGDFCWKMVITTETGGVKLIYNGLPTETDDGTKTCDNTGTASQLSSTKAFNSSYTSPAYVGYMYNTVYKYNSKGYTVSTNVFTSSSYSERTYSYYYGDTATWNGSEYVLSNSDGSEVTSYVWNSNYSSLKGYYTCRDVTTNGKSCATVYYVGATSSSYMYYYAISGGKTKDDYKIKLATSVTDNGNGTYTLVNPIEITKADYGINYSNYKNYYYCSDLTSETCGSDIIMYYSTSMGSYSITGMNRANVYKYGNSFEDSDGDGIYELKDTKEFWDWSTNYNQINSNHYTCFNTSGECADLKYIYYTGNTTAYYIILTNGTTVEEAINEMLYAEDVNKTDSTIKDYIDTWYEGAILDKKDANGTLYSAYLENTIFCNNREMTNSSTNGWNPNGGSTTTYMYFNYNTLDCTNKTDQFTLKVEAGGTEGYGNNALDYPIGLISYKEASLASASGYLKSGSSYWLLSPYSFVNSIALGYRVYSGGYLYDYNVGSARGVRPAVSLSTSIEIIDGDGSVGNPYQIEKKG